MHFKTETSKAMCSLKGEIDMRKIRLEQSEDY